MRRGFCIATALLSATGCNTALAVRRFAGPDTLRLTISRDAADPLAVAWEAATADSGDALPFVARSSGRARLPDPPSGCGTWELVGVDGASQFYSRGPRALRVKRSHALTRRVANPGAPTDYDAIAPDVCQLEIAWSLEGRSAGVMRVREPGGEPSELFRVDTGAPAANGATWGNLAVAPLLDLVVMPIYVSLAFLFGVKC